MDSRPVALPRPQRHKRSARLAKVWLFGIGFTAVFLVSTSTLALASTSPGLGTANSFAILAGTTVTSTGNTVITGDVGISPGSACTGLPAPCTGGGPGSVNGAIHPGDAVALQAKSDLTAAYGIAASSPCNFDQTGQNLGGKTLTPGTYCQTTAPTLSGTLTLSGNGVFIFQIGKSFVTAPGATVSFINGAQPCNVFWKVGSDAVIDTTTTFVGTIMVGTSITLNNGASIDGRAFAQTGQVSLINNRITAPTTCSATTVPGPSINPKVAKVATPRTGASGDWTSRFGFLLLMSGASLITLSRRRQLGPVTFP